jgi:hypothetical protein
VRARTFADVFPTGFEQLVGFGEQLFGQADAAGDVFVNIDGGSFRERRPDL